jgi:hypothetical protein
MDSATRVLLRSALKLLVEAQNHGALTREEALRVHAAYRRLVIALNIEGKQPERS